MSCRSNVPWNVEMRGSCHLRSQQKQLQTPYSDFNFCLVAILAWLGVHRSRVVYKFLKNNSSVIAVRRAFILQFKVP